MLLLDEAKKKEELEKNAKIEKLLISFSRLKREFKIYTAFFNDETFCFVLDHIYDKEAISARLPELRNFKPVFYTKQEFTSAVLEQKNLLLDRTIVYSPEKYFEILSEIKSDIYMRHSILSGESR